MRIALFFIVLSLFFKNVFTLPRSISFVKASLPERFRINTCFPTRSLAGFVTSRLETCGVTSPVCVIGMGECQGSCAINPNCVGFAYTKTDRMCTHCDQSILSGQGLDIPHDEVIIAVERLEAYINGKHLHIVFYKKK